MKVIIDRFEGDTAVLECNGEMLNAPAKLFENAKEGDHIEICVIKDSSFAKKREKDIQEFGEKKDIKDAAQDVLQCVAVDASSQKTEDQEDEENMDTKAMFERLRKKSKKADR